MIMFIHVRGTNEQIGLGQHDWLTKASPDDVIVIVICQNNMALFWILFLTLLSSKATVSVKEARSEPYIVK